MVFGQGTGWFFILPGIKQGKMAPQCHLSHWELNTRSLGRLNKTSQEIILLDE